MDIHYVHIEENPVNCKKILKITIYNSYKLVNDKSVTVISKTDWYQDPDIKNTIETINDKLSEICGEKVHIWCYEFTNIGTVCEDTTIMILINSDAKPYDKDDECPEYPPYPTNNEIIEKLNNKTIQFENVENYLERYICITTYYV